jgi:DNA repair protein RecO (recombination protein O)
MLIKTRGIVFRSIKYSETSIIADIYTEEKGMRSYLINGVRSKRAKIKASLLQVMSIVDMVAYDKNEKGLNRIKEMRSAYTYQHLPFDIRRSAVGLFIAEIARKTIREPEENERLFNFLFQSFHFLDTTENAIANVHLWFLLRLSAFLGFMPGGQWTEKTPFFDLEEGIFETSPTSHVYFLKEAESKLIDRLLDLPLEECHTLTITPQERKVLLRHLIDYYRLHIENMPGINAHLILEEVFG